MGETGGLKIKAIETVYNGYRFRSRLEARWAVFFDALGIEYEYEPEGFDLGEIGYYLPDFWLPEWSTWIEVKATSPTVPELEKITALAYMRSEYGFILFGSPGRIKLDVDINTGAWNLSNGALMVGYSPAVDQDGDAAFLYDPTVRAWAETQGEMHLTLWPFYSASLPNVSFVLGDCIAPIRVCPVFPYGLVYRGYDGDGVGYYTPRLSQAYRAARQARFEHGETPNV